jgi:hypothetical protein
VSLGLQQAKPKPNHHSSVNLFGCPCITIVLHIVYAPSPVLTSIKSSPNKFYHSESNLNVTSDHCESYLPHLLKDKPKNPVRLLFETLSLRKAIKQLAPYCLEAKIKSCAAFKMHIL